MLASSSQIAVRIMSYSLEICIVQIDEDVKPNDVTGLFDDVTGQNDGIIKSE